MPFQPINFASIAPQGNPLARDLVQNLMQSIGSGMQLANMPGQMKRQAEHEELANQLARYNQSPDLLQQKLMAQQVENAHRESLTKKNLKELDPLAKFKDMQEFLNNAPPEVEQQFEKTPGLRDAFIRMTTGLAPQTNQEKVNEGIEKERRELSSKKDFAQYENQLIKDRTAYASSLKSLQNQKKADDEALGLTPTTKTNLQKQVQGIETVVPLLKKIGASDFILNFPSDPANFSRDVKTLVDSYISAKSLPNTNESIDLVKGIFEKKWYESPAHYKKRIDEEIDGLSNDKKRKIGTLKSGKISEESDSEKELHYDPSTGKFK